MTGNISTWGCHSKLCSCLVANKGFIQQYGTALNAKGQLILDADILAAWGGIQSAGQGFGMLSQHL
jgi:hypothetical protein